MRKERLKNMDRASVACGMTAVYYMADSSSGRKGEGDKKLTKHGQKITNFIKTINF